MPFIAFPGHAGRCWPLRDFVRPRSRTQRWRLVARHRQDDVALPIRWSTTSCSPVTPSARGRPFVGAHSLVRRQVDFDFPTPWARRRPAPTPAAPAVRPANLSADADRRPPARRGAHRIRRARRARARRRRPRRRRLRPAVQDPGRGDPRRPRRPRRVRPGAHRVGQDAGVRRADAVAHRRPGGSRPPARARPRADPRARRAGVRGARTGRQPRRPAGPRRVRRVEPAAPGRAARRGRRDRRRHAACA